MTILDRAREAAVKVGLAAFKAMILNLSDRALSRFFRVVRWIAYLVTADKMVRLAISDAIDLFESGPPFSATFRKMIGGAEPEVIASILRCMRKNSPYSS